MSDSLHTLFKPSELGNVYIPPAGASKHKIATARSGTEIPVLTNKSPKKEPSKDCKVVLWDHQKAMLHRCLKIESSPSFATTTVKNAARYQKKENIPKPMSLPIGVMNDPPGSGKTYAILAVIAEDKQPALNLIVVPQNIFKQWEKAIQTIYPEGNRIRVHSCNDYAEVMRFYDTPAVFKDYDIVLVNDIYAESLATSINDNKVRVKRLIIDEIDNVQDRLFTPIAAEHLWLVSASYAHEEGEFVGPYKITKAEIPNIFCRCDPAFVSAQLKFEAPHVEKIMCEDNEIQLFQGFFDKDIMSSLHAGDKRILLKAMEKNLNPRLHTLPAILKIRMEDLRKVTDQINKYKEILRLRSTDMDEYEKQDINDRIKDLQLSLQIADKMEERLGKYVPSDPAKLKAALFKSEVCVRIKGLPDSKWLLFNDNASALFEAKDILYEHGIKSVLLDGGSAAEIDKAIQKYKNGDIQVLLLNSKMEGAGMNLENTSHLLFMHATDAGLVEQVVGRAQRYGRVGRLQILGLFDKSEDPSLSTF